MFVFVSACVFTGGPIIHACCYCIHMYIKPIEHGIWQTLQDSLVTKILLVNIICIQLMYDVLQQNFGIQWCFEGRRVVKIFPKGGGVKIPSIFTTRSCFFTPPQIY